MGEIKQILMKRDGLTPAQADREIAKAKRRVAFWLERGDMEMAEQTIEEELGLEPEYYEELF